MTVRGHRLGNQGAFALLGLAAAVMAAPAWGLDVTADPRVATTFDQVLTAPDDNDTNLKYAREQASAGNLVGAAAALERLLLQQPDWHAVRLFYAGLLYRLDDLQAAKRELAVLKGSELGGTLRAEADKYAALIARRESRTSLGGQVAVGVGYDSDAVGALATAVDLGAGQPRHDDGLSVVASASATGARRLGDGDGVELFASVAGVSKTSIAGPDQRYMRGEARAGLGFSNGQSNVRAAALVRYVRVDGASYLTETGGRVEAVTKLSPRLSLTGAVEIVHQDFDEISNVPLLVPNSQRTGASYDAMVGLGYRLTGRQSIGVEFGYENKNAVYDPFGFSGPRLSASYAALLGRGSYFALAGQIRWLDYKATDLLISGVRRHDVRSYVRAALGAPLSAFSVTGSTHDFREQMRLEGALSYVRRDSSAPFTDYDSFGAEMRMIYKFGT